MKNKKINKKNIESDVAAKQIQNKRFHQKVKESGKFYKRNTIIITEVDIIEEVEDDDFDYEMNFE